MRDVLYPWSTSFRLLEEDDCYLMNITYILREVNGDIIRSFVSPILLTYATTRS